jgi:hypothetical protein
MRVKGMFGAGVAALVSGMGSLFMGAGLSESRSAGDEGNSAGQRHEKSTERKVVREEFIVFAAVASAYLLAWAASRVFQQ